MQSSERWLMARAMPLGERIIVGCIGMSGSAWLSGGAIISRNWGLAVTPYGSLLKKSGLERSPHAMLTFG